MISSVFIENFRNHRFHEIKDISSLFAITGQNGSGKSNVLRALNLFFNGEIESGESIDIYRDYNGPAKKKKTIRISCKFELPERFNFHKSIRNSADEIGLMNESFWLSRVWGFDDNRSFANWFEYKIKDDDDWERIASEKRSTVDTFLNVLIRFRYIPNHLHPVEIIRREERALQHALFAKIRSKRNPERRVDLERQLELMAAVGQELVEPIVKEITEASGLEDMTITLPTDWTQITLSFDMNLQSSEDEPRHVNLHGSGHQSLLALSLLHFLDTWFFKQFGWRQASIWALEEPESFLHQELCLQVGGMLSRFTHSPKFQILVTTHSPWVMTSCRNGCVVTPSSIETYLPKELIEQSARAGASPYLHPLLSGAPKPLLLVEGKIDKIYIVDAYKKCGRVNPWDVREIKEINNREGISGLDEIAKNHALVLQGRPSTSPIVLLYDHHEKEGNVNKMNNKLKEYHKTSAAIQWSSDECNPDLNSKYFNGIEAFLSTDFLKKASQKLPFSLYSPTGRETPISIDRQEFEDSKTRVAKYAEERARKRDYNLLMKQLQDMEKRVGLR